MRRWHKQEGKRKKEMSIFDQLNARVLQINTRGKKAGDDVRKFTKEHQVRLFAYPHDPSKPIVELRFHYNVGKEKTVLCPGTFGKYCEICDYCDYLKGWKTRDGKDKEATEKKNDWKVFQKLEATSRFFVPSIERDKEDDGVKFVRLTTTQLQKILDICKMKDRQQACGAAEDPLRVVLDPKKAFDLKFTVKKAGTAENKKQYDETVIDASILVSELGDKKAVQKYVGECKKIEELFPERTPEEVSKILKEFIDSGAPEQIVSGASDTVGESTFPTNSNENAVDAGRRNLNTALKELLGEDVA
jgi:hypothetical protein